MDAKQVEQTAVTGLETGLVSTPPRGGDTERQDVATRFKKGESGNKKGRPRKDAKATASGPTSAKERADGWYSLLMGMGTTGRDKRESLMFQTDTLDWDTAAQLYRGDPFAARIVDTMPNDMMREGFELCITDGNDHGEAGEDAPLDDNDNNAKAKTDASKTRQQRRADARAKQKRSMRMDGAAKDLAEDIEHEWETLGIMAAIHDCLKYERAYGGAALLLGVDDGATDLSQPLGMGNIKAIKYVTALEPREIQPVAWYGNPLMPKFGEPALYRLVTNVPGVSYQPANVSGPSVLTNTIHESRLVIFEGIRVTRRNLSILGGWGDSILTRVWRVLRDFNMSWSAAAILIADFAQAVFKVKGLNELLVEDPKDLFKLRMQGMELSRNVSRAVMIDANDEFKREATPVAGLSDLLQCMAQAAAAASDYPLPLFLGESPGGINASGASGDQLRMYYDKAKSGQNRKVIPALRRITECQFAVRKVDPDAWSIKARPLWQPTEKEQAETRKIQADIDVEYMEHDVYSSKETREARFGGDGYSFETPIKQDESTDMSAEDAYRAEIGAGGDGSTAPSSDPNAPAGATGGTNVAATAMNGAQITSLLEVITSANTKTISRESAAAVLRLAFRIADTDANDLLGPITFVATPPPAPPSPFGGGAPGAPKPPTPPDAPTPPAKPEAPVAPEKPVAPKADAIAGFVKGDVVTFVNKHPFANQGVMGKVEYRRDDDAIMIRLDSGGDIVAADRTDLMKVEGIRE